MPLVSVACEMLARLPPVHTAWSVPASKAPYPQAAGLRASLCWEPTADGAAVPGGGPGRGGGWLSCRALWMAACCHSLPRQPRGAEREFHCLPLWGDVELEAQS